MSSVLTVFVTCFGFSIGLVGIWHTYRKPAPLTDTANVFAGKREKLGYSLSNVLNRRETTPGLQHQLALVNKSENTLTYEQFLSAATGFVVSILFSALFLTTFLLLGLIAVPALTFLGWVIPRKNIEKQAEQKKSSMRQTLVVYQELAATAVAGGQSIQSALRNAAQYGDGDTWTHIRTAISESFTSEKTFASGIATLADFYQLEELRNLAGLVEVADEGGTSKTSLKDLAKQQSRKHAHQTLDDAENNTSKLVLPTALVFLSFVLLLGFAVMDGLTQITL